MSVPVVTLIVPTRNEAANIAELVGRTVAAMADFGVDYEILFVDDSDDNTPGLVAKLAETHPVRLLHRTPDERVGSISGAVTAGLAATSSDVVAIIDADLQHPPEVLPALLTPVVTGSSEVVIGTRYAGEGSADGLEGRWRLAASKLASAAVRITFPRLRHCTDPCSGLFAFRREILRGVELRPVGFKIVTEVMVRGSWNNLHEVPYDFEQRSGGTSNASIADGLEFLHHLGRLRLAVRHRDLPSVTLTRGLAAGLPAPPTHKASGKIVDLCPQVLDVSTLSPGGAD